MVAVRCFRDALSDLQVDIILDYFLSISQSIERTICPHTCAIALPIMAKDLKVVVDKPVEVLALRTQRPCKSVASFGVVSWRIGIVAVVFFVLVASQVDCRARLVNVDARILGVRSVDF